MRVPASTSSRSVCLRHRCQGKLVVFDLHEHAPAAICAAQDCRLRYRKYRVRRLVEDRDVHEQPWMQRIGRVRHLDANRQRAGRLVDGMKCLNDPTLDPFVLDTDACEVTDIDAGRCARREPGFDPKRRFVGHLEQQSSRLDGLTDDEVVPNDGTGTGRKQRECAVCEARIVDADQAFDLTLDHAVGEHTSLRLLCSDLGFEIAPIRNDFTAEFPHAVPLLVGDHERALGFGHFDARERHKLLPRFDGVAEPCMP